MIYLRFLTSKWSLESALIRFGTRSPYSHVEFVDTVKQLALGARLKGGVRFRPINYCNTSSSILYSAPGITASYEAGMEFIGDSYDWTDIAGLVLNKNWHRDQSMICSQFVFYANLRAWAKGKSPAWLNPNRPSYHCTPDLLLWSPLLQEVKQEDVLGAN